MHFAEIYALNFGQNLNSGFSRKNEDLTSCMEH